MHTQRKFFGEGTLGAENGKITLEAVIAEADEDGFEVVQIFPTTFQKDASGVYTISQGVVLLRK